MVKLDDLLRERRLTSTLTRPILLDTDAAAWLQQAQADHVAAARQRDRASDRVEEAANLDGNRLERPNLAAAQSALEQADAALAEAAEELAEAEAEAEKHLVDFVFESVGAALWQRLADLNTSTAEQRERLGDDDPGWNVSRFPIVAVAFCLKDPEIPQAERDDYLDDDVADEAERPLPPTAVKLHESVPDIVWQQIVAAAVQVNRGPNRVPKSLIDSRRTATSEPKSERPSI